MTENVLKVVDCCDERMHVCLCLPPYPGAGHAYFNLEHHREGQRDALVESNDAVADPDN